MTQARESSTKEAHKLSRQERDHLRSIFRKLPERHQTRGATDRGAMDPSCVICRELRQWQDEGRP